MNRRGFLAALSRAAVGTAVAVAVPASVIKAVAPEASYGWAQRRMLHAYHTFVRQYGSAPTAMFVGLRLHDLYERDLPLIRRWTEVPSTHSIPGLKFKSLTLRIVGKGYAVGVAG